MSKTEKPSFKNNFLYPNTKYVNKDMYMTDNENNKVIEDILTRNKKFKKNREMRGERLIELGAPEFIIEHEKYIATLTEAEYKSYLKKEAEKEKVALNEYMKNNPLKEEVVKKLFDAFGEIVKTFDPMLDSTVCFNYKLDPLKYVDEVEFDMGVYDDIIYSLYNEYNEKWKVEMDIAYAGAYAGNGE